MKTVALAVGVSPLAVMAKPEIDLDRTGDWYELKGTKWVLADPEVTERAKRFSKEEKLTGNFFFKREPVVYTHCLTSETGTCRYTFPRWKHE